MVKKGLLYLLRMGKFSEITGESGISQNSFYVIKFLEKFAYEFCFVSKILLADHQNV